MATSYQFTYQSDIEMIFGGLERTFEIEVDYRFIASVPPSGAYGPPEHYDPGAGCEVDITGMRVRAEGEETWHTAEQWLLDLARSNAGLQAMLEEDGEGKAIEANLEMLDARDEERAERAREDRDSAE